MTSSSAWARARRILCVRLDAMGDLLMTTPALGALRRLAPQAKLTLLTSASGAEVARLIPSVDDVIRYDAPWLKAPSSPSADADLRMAARLRRRRFDAAVIFTVYTQSPLPAALVCHLAGVPLRLAHCRENPYRLLSDWVPEREPDTVVRHEVRRQLDLVAAVGGPPEDTRLSLSVPPAARRSSLAVLRDAGLDPRRPWVALHPGGTASSRRYPPMSFAALGTALVERGLQVVFTGSLADVSDVGRIRDAMAARSLSVAGSLSVAELAAALESASVLVSNNTGPVHIAAAVGTPVAVLYALTNPQHTPWMVPNRVLFHDVACRFCYKSVCPEGHHDCLRLVAPATVEEAVMELLEGGGESVEPTLLAAARGSRPRPPSGS